MASSTRLIHPDDPEMDLFTTILQQPPGQPLIIGSRPQTDKIRLSYTPVTLSPGLAEKNDLCLELGYHGLDSREYGLVL